MSERSGHSLRDAEEEKRRFDRKIHEIEKKVSGNRDKDESTGKNNQELMEQCKIWCHG